MSSTETKNDWIIAMGVLSQPIWLLLQHCFIFLFHVDALSATLYRTIMVGFPMVVAIIIAFRRKPTLFFVVYSIVFSLLLLTIALYPENAEYVRLQGTRFLLPVVLPSALCLVCVKDFEIVTKTINVVSWICACLGIVLAVTYFGGVWSHQGYNMSLSYGLLFPIVFLISQRRITNYLISFLLLVFVLAVGSRGALFCFVVFMFFYFLQLRRRSWWSFILLFIVLFLYLNISYIDLWFQSLGISSRTINMYNDDVIVDDTGRSSIQSYFIAQLLQHPFFGIGLFGDRTVPNIAYCHNMFLEILLNFGFIVGGAIIIWLIIFATKGYLRCDDTNKTLLIGCICVFLLPLMFSGSYLIDYSSGVFIGILFLLHKHTTGHKQSRRAY